MNTPNINTIKTYSNFENNDSLLEAKKDVPNSIMRMEIIKAFKNNNNEPLTREQIWQIVKSKITIPERYLNHMLGRESDDTSWVSQKKEKQLFKVVSYDPKKYILNSTYSEQNLDKESDDSETESDQLTNNNQLFEDIKKASTDIYNCLTSTPYLCNKLNKIDKEYFKEYLDFPKVGPVNDIRKEVATYLVENNITPLVLDEIIKKHKKEKPNQLRAWLNAYKILHPFINQEYKHFDEKVENFTKEISNALGVKYKINNFNGSQQQGSEKYWIAFYNKELEHQSRSLQLFINFEKGGCNYGIYKHNGTEYLVGPETYTTWEKFSNFISENIHYILEDTSKEIEDSSEITTSNLDTKKMSFVKAAQVILQENRNEPMNSAEIWSQIQEKELVETSGLTPLASLNSIMILYSINSNAASKKKNSIFKIIEGTKPYKFILLNPNEVQDATEDDEEVGTPKEYVKNPFRQSICILGPSGKGKSTTTELMLEQLENTEDSEFEFIIPTASTTGLLSQYSPSGRYIKSRLGKMIMNANNNPEKIVTAVFDECHKSAVIEMINDELLQCISTRRNAGRRFISVDEETEDLYPGLQKHRGNLLIPNNFGFIFLSSKPDVIIQNSDFFNRVDIYVLTEQPSESADLSLDYDENGNVILPSYFVKIEGKGKDDEDKIKSLLK